MSVDLSPQSGRALSLAMIIIIFAVLTLLGIGIVRLAIGNDLVFGPTSTPTATARPSATTTPDFRASRIAEDVAAEQTYRAEIGYATPAIELTISAQDVFVPIVAQLPAFSPTPPLATPSPAPPADVLLPIVSSQEGVPTAPGSPLASPDGQESLPLPEETPTPLAPEVDATATATFTPVPTSTSGPPPPGFVAQSMRALVNSSNEQPARIYVGPSSIYTNTGTLDNGRQLDLTGRTASGEWVYSCCDADGDAFWIRQARARATDNNFVPALPTEEAQNDVRWLPTRLPPPELTPVSTPTAIPPSDYPLYRRNPANQAWVPELPLPPLIQQWRPEVSSDSLRSPLIVASNSIIGANGDNHVYFLGREAGNQRWRVLINGTSSYAPAYADGYVYLLDNSGRLLKLEINNAGIVLNRQVGEPGANSGGLNLVDEYVLVPARGTDANSSRLFLFRREDLGQDSVFTTEGGNLFYPAIGDQLVYAGDRFLYALDPFNGLDLVWRQDTGFAVSAPPVYSAPGTEAAAELYVADQSGQITALDANTGNRIWSFQASGQTATGLAVDENLVYVSGSGFVRALRRTNGENAWSGSVGVNDTVLGGPIVGANEILIITADGTLRYLNKLDGATVATASTGTRLTAAGAVSPPWIYVPGVDRRIYGWQGDAQ